jgi:two-component system NtrC family sensor kinase
MEALAKKKEILRTSLSTKQSLREGLGHGIVSPSSPIACRVLVVDDEEPVRLLLARILKPEGYLVELASNASQARQIMSKQPFDVVLCDLTMPGESGMELARWIIETCPQSAVVIVSVVSDPKIAESALEIGIHGYVPKPFTPEAILINVAGAVKRKQLEEENRSHRERLEQAVKERTASLRSTISKLRKTREALRRAQESYRNLFDRIPLGLFRTTPEGQILDANKALVQMLGFPSRDELLRANAALLYLDPSARLRWKKAIQRQGLVKGFQKELRRRDGKSIWVEENTTAVRDGRGRIICFEGSIQDVTERKLMEQALRESQERLQELFEQAPVGYFEYDRYGRIFNVNRTQQEMLGYTREEILGRCVWEFFIEPEPGRSQVLAKLAGALPPAVALERYYRRRDGSTLVGLIQDKLILDDQGMVRAIRCTVQDITERKAMEDELRKAHDEKELLLSAISSILIGVSSQGVVTQWNKAAAWTLGVAREDALGARLKDLRVQWDIKSVEEGVSRCLESGEACRLEEIIFARRDGKEGFLGLNISPVGRPGRPLDGVLILGADITERRILERQLVQAQKLESIGQLAAGIAHEINTPVQYIGDNTRFLRDAWGEILPVLEKALRLLKGTENWQEGSSDFSRALAQALEKTDLEYLQEEIPKAIEQSLDGVERVAGIVRAMKEFSHPGKRENTSVDINRSLESTITVCRNEWKYVAELVTELDPSLPLVQCDPGEINQVFLNLIINASHAIGEKVKDGSKAKGLIRISTHNRGSWVEVRIQDTGTGIPEAIRSRIFDPFFTTKEVGRGTGQGLAICHSVIVNKLGGSLDFETEVGRGTTFIARIPASDPQTPERDST